MSQSPMEPIVLMKDIVKDFPGVRAVDGGFFDLMPGEAHALIGENGAGKSTLMKILYGVYQPDSGVITVKGETFPHQSPGEAISRGIGMVHQEFMLVQQLTVLENVILGFEPRVGMGKIDFKAAEERISAIMDGYGLKVDLRKKVNDISVGEAQRVEIVKALYRGADVLILDEPTAVLTPQEAEGLFQVIRSLTSLGKSVIFISHKLNEVMEVASRVTVMRQGRHIGTVEKSATSIPELARLMVGRDVFLGVQRSGSAKAGDVALEVRDIYVPSSTEHSKIRGVSFQVRRSEILGIAGVDGNGQSELAEAIAGLRPVERGQVIIDGVQVQNLTPLQVRQAGLAHIPEDRNTRGLNRTMTVKENLAGLAFRKPPISKGLAIVEGALKEFAERLISAFDVRPPLADAPVTGFSGGNAQKIVVAREVDSNPKVLLACQPTRGVDIGSIENIRKELVKVRDRGTAIVLISADLEEILSLSDRIAVMYEGRITGIIDADEADEERLGLLMTGGAVNG